MAQESNLGDSSEDELPELEVQGGMSGALRCFDAVRSALAEQAESEFRPRRPRSDVLSARDMAMMAELGGIHDAMSEIDQLRIYRFFLTAVHRNGISAHRFDSAIIVSPERVAALEAEFHEVSHDLSLLIDEFAAHSSHDDKLARAQAATFLWTMSWWIHARIDVTVYAPRLADEDLLTALLLGQAPDPGECVVAQMYKCAAKSELAYRRALMIRPTENSKLFAQMPEFAARSVPLAVRQESHM